MVVSHEIHAECAGPILEIENRERNCHFSGPPVLRPLCGGLPIALPLDLARASARHCVGLRTPGVHGEFRDLPVVVVRVELDHDVIVQRKIAVALPLFRVDGIRLRVVTYECKIELLVIGDHSDFSLFPRRAAILGNPEILCLRGSAPDVVIGDAVDKRRHCGARNREVPFMSRRRFAGLRFSRRSQCKREGPSECNWKCKSISAADARKKRTNNKSDMECGDLPPLSFLRRGNSGDKSPHSERAVIAHLHLTKAAPKVTRTFNWTLPFRLPSQCRRDAGATLCLQGAGI